MKITDPQIITNGEKDLIASVQKNLDPETVRKILKDRMVATSLSSKGGQIVVHDQQVAFRLDFDLQLSGSLLFDRQGNYIPDSDGPESPSEERKQMDTDIDENLAETDLDPISETDDTNPPPISPMHQDDDTPPDLLDDHDNNLPLEETKDPPSLTAPSDDLDDLDDLNDDDLEFSSLDLEDENDQDQDDMLDDDNDQDDMLDDDNDQDDMLDDDINDILKESREFWEHKNDT